MTGEKGKPETVLAASSLPAQAMRPAVPLCIVGLGPGPVEGMTLAAWQAITTAPRLVLRTERHPAVAGLPPAQRYETCDDLYESNADFAAVYAAITQRILDLARKPEGVVYAVPGHPWVGEATTPLLLAAAAEAGLETAVIGGMSFIEPCYAAVGVDPMDGSQIIDAMLLAQQHHPRLDPGLPLLVGQVYSRAVASDVKLTLLNAYPDEHPVQVIQAAGGARASRQTLPLFELDRRDAFDHLTSVYVPPLPAGSSYSHLQEIVAHLRAPAGCPWDREQTLESLKQDLLSECVEVLEAIDRERSLEHGEDNSAHIAEELGDLLLVATMMVQIAAEEGRFQLGDVTRGIVEKLIRRHPHVFGDTVVNDADEVVSNWDAIKAAEKTAKGETASSPLDGVPVHLPALEKARQLQAKAEKAGLLDRRAVAAAFVQQVGALRAQLAESAGAHEDAASADNTTAVLGELLWTLAAVAHGAGVNAEDALRAYTVAFRRQHP